MSAIVLPQVRALKTKQVVQLRDLPQGQLAPLPAEPRKGLPERTYPTVLQQHLDNTRKFSDCVVLTRVGDFYEMYFEQVEQYAHLVNLKKAKRATSLGDVPMAGFQHTQLDRYLKMFVMDLGKQVAISEQVRIPEEQRIRSGTTMRFDRKVTRVVTAGTLIDETFVDAYDHNYLLAVHFEGPIDTAATLSGNGVDVERYKRATGVGLSWVDLSSGDFYTQVSDLASLASSVARIAPREIVLNETHQGLGHDELRKVLGEGIYAVHFQSSSSVSRSIDEWAPMLEQPVPASEHEVFTHQETMAGSLVLDYIHNKLPEAAVQLQCPVRKSDREYMAIDRHSLRGLEICSTARDGTLTGSLLHAVRRTVTKSGARLLRSRLVSPSLTLSVIENRLDLVQEMVHHEHLLDDITGLLKLTSDTLRLLQRFSIGKGDADDLLSLAQTVGVMQRLVNVLHDHILYQQNLEDNVRKDFTFLWDILGRFNLDAPVKVAKAISDAIDEEGLNRRQTAEAEAREEAGEMADEVENTDALGEPAPKLAKRSAKSKATLSSQDNSETEIWVMRQNASPTLQRAHQDLTRLLDDKSELIDRLRTKSKAPSLTLRWSAALGHFCHIKGRDAQANIATLDRARVVSSTKSTKSFYVLDWTHLGTRIEEAKLRIRTEEERVFGKLRGQVIENLMKLRRNAAVLDELDVACSFAIVAKENNFVRPLVHGGTSHFIVGGRHPTVDVGLRAQGRRFTPNDCTVGEGEMIQLITGPNMAGKSTYLRQSALLTILAQTGSFVPAEYAKIGLVDKIFSRVGSADNLYQDQSTFMVEMLETAEILKQATPRSFVIMDEVGRGTTPEDGISVGYACLHHLHYTNRCRALFATHFHALTDMTASFDMLACYCSDVAEEQNGAWAYEHKMRKGVNRDSHALKVARMAGMPEDAIKIAQRVLADQRKQQYMTADDGLETLPVLAASG